MAIYVTSDLHGLELKKLKELLKKGVKEWNPQYYAQVIVGMELSSLKKCLHITVNKNTDEIYAESIKPSVNEATRLLNRAERVSMQVVPDAGYLPRQQSCSGQYAHLCF